jgi:hypothetical protein
MSYRPAPLSDQIGEGAVDIDGDGITFDNLSARSHQLVARMSAAKCGAVYGANHAANSRLCGIAALRRP